MKRSEKAVTEVLKDLGLRWSNEHPVFLWDEQGRLRGWAPDFYINNLDVHIEVCGFSNFNYDYR
jgi:hypothetical protein